MQESSIMENEAFQRSYSKLLVIEFYRTFGGIYILRN